MSDTNSMLRNHKVSKFYDALPSYKVPNYERLKFKTMSRYSTGQKCPQSGIYKCSIHTSNEIALSVGETFPPCSRNGGHGATWILVRATR